MSFSKLKKDNFHYLKKGGSYLWNAIITPFMCIEDVKTLHIAALSNVEIQCLLI